MKTILITGSTDGIGKLAAMQLAKAGHEVLIHGRNSNKLQQVLSEFQTVSHKVKGYVADLSDFDSVNQFVKQLKSQFEKIDVLINNAGVFHSNVEQSKNTLDIRFTVNYFAPYLLTHGLLSLLEKSNEPRVINLSSAAQSSVSINALKGNEILTPQNAYAQSKLALTMWSFVFSKAHPEINIIAVNPGSLLNTKMVQEAYGQHWSSANKGSDILCDIAISEMYAAYSGKYFDNDKGAFNKAHVDAYDDEKINRLIFETNKILNL